MSQRVVVFEVITQRSARIRADGVVSDVQVG